MNTTQVRLDDSAVPLNCTLLHPDRWNGSPQPIVTARQVHSWASAVGRDDPNSRMDAGSVCIRHRDQALVLISNDGEVLDVWLPHVADVHEVLYCLSGWLWIDAHEETDAEARRSAAARSYFSVRGCDPADVVRTGPTREFFFHPQGGHISVNTFAECVSKCRSEGIENWGASADELAEYTTPDQWEALARSWDCHSFDHQPHVFDGHLVTAT